MGRRDRELGRFRTGQSRAVAYSPDQLRQLSEKQTPKVAIIACSDSRVTPEVVFDQPLGTVFASRVPGNVASDSAKWMLEIGTFLMRASFLLAARRMAEVPEPARRVLRQIPPAAMAALVLPAFLRPDGELDLWQPELAAGLLAAAVCWRTRSIAATLVTGMVAVFLLNQL